MRTLRGRARFAVGSHSVPFVVPFFPLLHALRSCFVDILSITCSLSLAVYVVAAAVIVVVVVVAVGVFVVAAAATVGVLVVAVVVLLVAAATGSSCQAPLLLAGEPLSLFCMFLFFLFYFCRHAFFVVSIARLQENSIYLNLDFTEASAT